MDLKLVSRICPAFALLCCIASAAEPKIERILPPPGIEIPTADRERLASEVSSLKDSLASVRDRPHSADIEVFIKAVDLALLHGEFYAAKDVQKADRLLSEATTRLAQLKSDRTPWHRQSGLVVRGYRSMVDGSVQPYGLEIPAEIDLNSRKQVPLYVWLHGRGDTATDLHFIDQRQTKPGQIHPPGAIVLHPFGRQCVGFKSAGETDVWEATWDVLKKYSIDPNRIVLIGFSMGGAGAWHLGAHYATPSWRSAQEPVSRKRHGIKI